MGKQAPNSIVTCGSFPAASPDSVLSPLERDPRSPKGWRKRASDGVGLGIVVALERSSSSSASDVPAKIVANSHLPQYYHHHHHHHHHQRPTSPPSTPPVPAARHLQRRWSIWDEEEEQEAAGPATFFCGSPPPRIPIDSDSVGPAPGFLKYCQLCRKKLDGEDIYMYRGEKAFCSAECRSQQIAADEYHQEPRSYYNMAPTRTSQAAAAPVSGLPDRPRLFYTGIMAA